MTAGPLLAGTTGATMAVTATVEESCHLNAGPVDFGTMPAAQATAEAQSSLLLACTPATSYIVTLDEGRNSAGGARRMADASGTRFLAYELFSDATRAIRWGATPASGVSGTAPADGRVELGVYAHVSQSDKTAGAYGDTITVTVAF